MAGMGKWAAARYEQRSSSEEYRKLAESAQRAVNKATTEDAKREASYAASSAADKSTALAKGPSEHVHSMKAHVAAREAARAAGQHQVMVEQHLRGERLAQRAPGSTHTVTLPRASMGAPLPDGTERGVRMAAPPSARPDEYNRDEQGRFAGK